MGQRCSYGKFSTLPYLNFIFGVIYKSSRGPAIAFGLNDLSDISINKKPTFSLEVVTFKKQLVFQLTTLEIK